MNQEQNKETRDVIDFSKFRSNSKRKSQLTTKPPYSPTTPEMVKKLIKLSGVRISEKQAYYVLLIIVVTFLFIATVLLVNTFKGPSKPPEGLGGNNPRDPLELQNLLQLEDFSQ